MSHRTVLHIDIDAFYVAAERARNPSLAGKPVAVCQFNSGGFVAVSHEAREAGIRKGDGVGDAGRAAIRWLREHNSISMEEARTKCPALIVLPMDTDYYRSFSSKIHQLLRSSVGAGNSVERASCDDFYCEIGAGSDYAATAFEVGWHRTLDCCHVYDGAADCGGGHVMSAGEEVARRVRAALRTDLGITASVGIACNRLLAKLVGARHRPDQQTFLPPMPSLIHRFARACSINSFPGLNGKLGHKICEGLSVQTAGQLLDLGEKQLSLVVGHAKAVSLRRYLHGEDNRPVTDLKGCCPQSIMVERSCKPENDMDMIWRLLRTLVPTLISRMVSHAIVHGQHAQALAIKWRRGYQEPVVLNSKTLAMTNALAEHMSLVTASPSNVCGGGARTTIAEDGCSWHDDHSQEEGQPCQVASSPPEKLVENVLEAFAAALRSAVQHPLQITRIIIGACNFRRAPPVMDGKRQKCIRDFFVANAAGSEEKSQAKRGARQMVDDATNSSFAALSDQGVDSEVFRQLPQDIKDEIRATKASSKKRTIKSYFGRH